MLPTLPIPMILVCILFLAGVVANSDQQGGIVRGTSGGIHHLLDCRPIEKQVLAGSCDNKNSKVERTCKFNLTIGLDYASREKGDEGQVYQMYEDIGLTLPCVKEELSVLFGSKLGVSQLNVFDWKDYTSDKPDGKIWNRVNKLEKLFIVPPGLVVNVLQIVGECFIYKVHTDRFIIITTNVTAKTRLVERIQIQSLNSESEPCLNGYLDITKDDPEKKMKLAEISPINSNRIINPTVNGNLNLQFPFKHKQEPKNFHYAPDGRSVILEGTRDLDLEANIIINVNHEWSEWKFCPKGSFISGYYHSAATAEDITKGNGPTRSDAFGIVDVAVRCSNPMGGNSSVIFQTTPGVQGEKDYSPLDDRFVGCGEGEIAIGFQLSLMSFQRFGDDVSLENIRLICSSGSQIAPDTSKMDKAWNLKGNWTDSQICPPKHGLCGFSVKALPIEWPTPGLQAYDNVGITNIQVQCCVIPSPASECSPEEELELVMECENVEKSVPRLCNVEIFTGLNTNLNTSDNNPTTLNNARLIKFYESIGYNLDCIGNELSMQFAKTLGMSRLGNFNWATITADKPEGKIWASGSSMNVSIKVEPFTKVSLYQVKGECGLHRIYSSYFTSITQNVKVDALSEDNLFIQTKASSQPLCWEMKSSVVARDWIATLTTPPYKCPDRSIFPSSSARFPFSSNDSTYRTGGILQLPNHPLSFHSWGNLGLCPNGSYIRGWSDLQVEVEGDKLGIVLISTLCEKPSAVKDRSFEIVHVLPGLEGNGDAWREAGFFNTLNCIGAGIGIEGRVQIKHKDNRDKFGFWDSRLICSCGLGSGYSASEKGGLYDNVKPEICKPRQALCGLQVSFGVNSVSNVDSSKVDGAGVTNMKGICCDIPSPVSDCKLKEKQILAATCDNRDSSFQRTCYLNLTIGVAYQYETQEAKSFFYDTNGFPAACVAPEIHKKVMQKKINCDVAGCSFKWKLGKSQIWQDKISVPITLVVEPFAKIEMVQVVAECGPLLAMSNYYHRSLVGKDGKVIRSGLYILELPPMASNNSTKCEFT